jgi:hypothetical protein
VVEFGVHDLLFLRRLQERFVKAVCTYPSEWFPKRSRPEVLEPGPLNLHFGRVIIQSRLARNRKGSLRREEVLAIWMEALAEVIDGFDVVPSGG